MLFVINSERGQDLVQAAAPCCQQAWRPVDVNEQITRPIVLSETRFLKYSRSGWMDKATVSCFILKVYICEKMVKII